ncbi:hypothetical protein [Solidesulfovibrio sp. C21]|uniref:hypothetical protein n=1 Tax=Solidesulfovibrio sp. C21 TaxID=3398613 RepID=UPI0039FB9D25
MAEGVIDLKKQLRDLKAHEHLAGFTGFRLDLGLGDAPKEGVLKIAEFVRPDASGYLTLTFQTDPDPEPDRRAALAGLFDRFGRFAQAADAVTGAKRFGQGFEYIMIASQGLADGDPWFVVDMDFYYKNLAGRLRPLIEDAVLPGLAGVMPVTFEPVNWWD